MKSRPLPSAGAARTALTTPLAAVLVTAFLVPAPLVAADPPPVLTLEQAIAVALDGNHELRAAAARSEAAAAGADEARALRLPRLDLAGAFQRTENPVLVFSNLLGQANFRQENFALDALNEPDPLSNWQSRLSLSLPLWTAGRLAAGIAAADLHDRAADAAQEAARQQTVHRVIEAYTAAVLAHRELAVTRESLATAQANVRLVSDLRQGGLVVESDQLQAELRESEVRELTIRAESADEVGRATLNLVLGRDLDTPFTLPEELDGAAADGGEEVDLEALLAQARERRPDLAAARHRAAAAERRRQAERAGRFGEVGVAGSYEANAEDFFGADGDSWAVTVGLRVPLFDAGLPARVRRAAAEQRASEEQAALVAASVELEVRRAASELRSAAARLDQAERGVTLAERSLGIVSDRYREGLTVLTEMLDAENSLTRARLRRAAAQRDVLLARATLDLATGSL